MSWVLFLVNCEQEIYLLLLFMSTHSFPGDNCLIGQGEKEVILQMLSCFLLKLLTHPLPYDVSIYKIEETLI